MANGIKTYQIQINGITESINAVESLNKQLSELENKIKALEKSAINVSAASTGGGGSSSSKASLSEEEKLAKQIEQIDAKRVAYSNEIYQNYLAAKDVLKETVTDQKSIAAAERLQANSYSNTIQGMKQELADIKSALQTVDLGDTDKMDAMVKRANELNEALKKIEESYGQFGRNVGNYASAAAGFEKIKVEVAGTTQEFDNAKQALMTLKKELTTLQVKKDQGMLLSEEELKRFEELPEIVAQLRSSIQDAGKPMDALMDTMQSIVALMQTGKGVAAFFGVDGDEIERSIQKLVALQNAMQGLQTIQKQIQTREGIGAWIAPFTTSIDKATAKLLTFNTTILGTGKAAKVAAVGIKAFSKALKVALSAGVLVVADLIIEKFMDLVESFNKVDEAAERAKETQKDLAEAYGNAQGKLTQYKTVVDNFNGSKTQEKKLVEELNKEFGDTLGTYKSLAEWQDVLKKKGDAYIQTLVNQAKAQAALNEVTAAYMNLEATKQGAANGDYSHWYQSRQQDAEAAARAIEKANQRIVDAEENLKKVITANENYAKEHGIGDYAPQITKNGKKAVDATKKIQDEIAKKEIDAMREGLNKKLRQLDEEERQTINKLKENGRKSAAEIQKVQNLYASMRKREIDEYLKKLEESIDKTASNIKKIQFDINIKDIDNKIDELENKLDGLAEKVPDKRTLLSRLDVKDLLGKNTSEEYNMAFAFYNARESGPFKNLGAYYKFLKKFIDKQNDEVKEEFDKIYDTTNGSNDVKKLAQISYAEKLFEEKYSNLIAIARDYNKLFILDEKKSIDKQTDVLEEAFKMRLFKTSEYYDKVIKKAKDFMAKQKALNEKLIREQAAKDLEAERQRYTNQYNDLNKQYTDASDTVDKFKPKNDDEAKQLEVLKKKRDTIYAQMEEALKQHSEKMDQINTDMNNKIAKNNLDADKNMSSVFEKYLDEQLSNFRDFQSKLNDELSRQPIMNSWGIVNLPQTKKQFEELKNATKTTMAAIAKEKEKLDKLFAAGLITQAAKNATLQQLNDLSEAIKKLFAQIEQESKQNIPKFIESCQVYVQAALDSFQTIMNEVWNAQDTAFDKEQEQLDKLNDELEKKLDEQQEIVQQHKDAIDSIEDELASSRGDRRQHLIDQLNAEMAAQRAAQKQEQKIQKEKEAAQKKQDALDKKRKKAQYERDMLQAIVNGAMAVTYAAMNAWPVPAIPMMALAAATTAIQLGIMASNKPYAKGGVLEGPSHKQGGIPVGNTGIEVEGKEYVIRKKSTTPNVELLDMINRSERKLNLDDFIDFYTSGRVKKNISSMSPRTRFAEGGTIPTITNDYAFDDRLLTAFEDYSNRPVYVSVVDINNRQDAVKNVQVLAGIE